MLVASVQAWEQAQGAHRQTHLQPSEEPAALGSAVFRAWAAWAASALQVHPWEDRPA